MKILLVVGILFAVGITGIFIAMSLPGNPVQTNEGIASGGNRTPEQFFRDGGRSFLSVTPDSNTINATIGSTVQIPLTLTHKTGRDPFPIVTVHYSGIKNIFQAYGYGDLKLNSIVQAPAYEFSILAGESKKIILTMSIPEKWPKSLVNGTIPMDVEFLDSENLDPKDFVTEEALVQIHIVG